MCKNKKNTLCAIVVSLLAVLVSSAIFASNNAAAEVNTITFDIAKGAVTITDAGYSGVAEDGTALTGAHLDSNQYRIIQSDLGIATTNTITVGSAETGVTGNFYIILAGVNIRNNIEDTITLYSITNVGNVYFGYSAFYANVAQSGTVAVILEDGTKNYLYSGNNRAGLEKAGKSKGLLLITCEKGYTAWSADSNSGHTDASGYSGCSDNCGYLDAKAGNAWTSITSKHTYFAGAGIGTCGYGASGANSITIAGTNALANLTIAGGNIHAMGAWGNTIGDSSGGGAAIGTGCAKSSGSTAGTITNLKITGGTINAYRGDNSAACIGGGYRSGYAQIFVYGGTINAGMNSAENELKNTKITTKKMRAAAIGGGGGGTESPSPAGATVTINGGEIYALGQYGSAIGAGAGGSDGDATNGEVNIHGGIITAKTTEGNGKGAGAAIGAGGSLGNGKGGQGTVNIYGGTITATSEGGADIGGGGTYSPEDDAGGIGIVTIEGGNITATSGGIGGGRANAGAGGGATVTISGGTIKAKTIGGGDSKKAAGGTCEVTISSGTVTVNNPDGVSIGGGDGSTTGGTGGKATLTVSGDAKLYTGSIGGGNGATIGPANVTINGGFLQGQVIMQGEGSTFDMTGGVIDNEKAASSGYYFVQPNGGAVWVNTGTATIIGGTIQNCNNSANLGGAIYLSGGDVNMSGGTIQNCKALDGGAVYVSGGNFKMSGGTIESNSVTQNGGAVAVNGGDFVMSQGTIIGNTAGQNGGGVSLSNGNFTMTGGEITGNTATGGDGGAIYISSATDSEILIRSGRIVNNTAGKSGGALGIYGQENASFTITIGLNVEHVAPGDGQEQTHKCDGNDEICPVIKENKSGVSGGGIYLSGSYGAKLLMFCIVESDNEVTTGASPSDFMMVDGGTLTISTVGENGNNGGNITINSSVQVLGGQVTLMGKEDNPKFNEPITVNVNEGEGSFFKDLREKAPTRRYVTVQYFENYEGSGQYISVDVPAGTKYIVQSALYSHKGKSIDCWILMETTVDGKHVEAVPKVTYAGGYTFTEGLNQDLILYAEWVTAGYTIVFVPGVTEFHGETTTQNFSYSEEKELLPNPFTSDGRVFTGWLWKDGDVEKTFSNQQVVKELTDKHGAELTFVAQWDLCSHPMTSYNLTSTDNTIKRECTCLGYSETAVLTGLTTTYDGFEHPATLEFDRVSSNTLYASVQWTSADLLITYTGKTWPTSPGAGDEKVMTGDPLRPINAGIYDATITVDGKSALVKVYINKADQPNPPPIPQYITENKTVTIQDNFDSRLEYLFSWYYEEDGQQKYEDSGWKPWNDSSAPITYTIERTYTKYYVDVRYAGDDNHNPSPCSRGASEIVYTGRVVFSISSDVGLNREDAKLADNSGIEVGLSPQSGYYIYAITQDITFWDGAVVYDGEYKQPTITVQISQAGQWTMSIKEIGESPLGEDKTLTIKIHFKGAELIPTVTADTVKNQEFKSIENNGESDVAITCDSAYTFRFGVKNYKHYTDPAITFSQSLPVDTTLIMMDLIGGTYWSYTVSPSELSYVHLNNFVRMGTNIPFEVSESTNTLNLQFVVDFSRCQTPPKFTSLTAQFTAIQKHPQGYQTVPALPSNAEAISSLRLEAAPVFTLGSMLYDDPLVEQVSYSYTITQGDVGTSKWDDRHGVLVVTPTSQSLPIDARLQAKIGNSTNAYPLTDGNFYVPVPLESSGTIELTLLSDIEPNQTSDFNFTAKLFLSNTKVGTTPAENFASDPGVALTYTITKETLPSVSAVLTSGTTLPTYNQDGTISSLYYTVSVADIPAGYKLKATVYSKSKDGSYASTPQSEYLTSVGNLTLNLNSFESIMKNQIGSLSLMLRIEVVDSYGKVVTYTPLYFVLVDSRQ